MSIKEIIEKNKRFSESCLWDWQRKYFDNLGIDAWVNQVPFYVTSNPFIANYYANLVVQFVRDWVTQYPASKQHPFYILELGTGSGRFSFYVLKKIDELFQDLGIKDISIRYIMSDFTKHNIQYWETHPALQPYLSKGMLDFALYNLESDEPITLIRENKPLSAKTLVNPLIVFANYIFDTISHDMFSVKNGKCRELLLTLTTDKQNMRDGSPIDWEQVNIDYQPNDISEHYYPDEHLNKILDGYKTSLKNSSFLFPIGGLRAIKKLCQLANDKLFLISSDKGYSNLESLENLDHPRLSFHGSFSMMVNFHAIAEQFKYAGGDYVLQSSRKGIKTVVFSKGFKFAQLPQTTVVIKQCVENFSPADYFILHRRISDSYQDCNLDTLASHLALSDWDPHIFMRINNRICTLLEQADSTTVEYLVNNMPKLLANFYYMPKSDNLPFEVGIFFHSLKQYPKALEYYERAASFLGENFGLIYNVALCQYFHGNHKEALEKFQHAIKLNPDSKEVKEWISHLEKAG